MEGPEGAELGDSMAAVADDVRLMESGQAELPELEAKRIPTQVKIVQLLCDFLRAPFDVRPRRLAVIISAWDVVEANTPGMSPDQWLAGNMSLLDQFLLTNHDRFRTRIYGVSAQGVDLGDDLAVDTASKLLASERVLIVDGAERGHDITVPLVRLMADD